MYVCAYMNTVYILYMKKCKLIAEFLTGSSKVKRKNTATAQTPKKWCTPDNYSIWLPYKLNNQN